MKNTLIMIFWVATLFLLGCGPSTSSSCYDEEEYFDEDEGYEDDTYCADVQYYNPNTGTRSTYSLNVDVEDNELVKIHWPNGGWLDDDHFSPEELDSDGDCSVKSHKGYYYEVSITGSECSYTDMGRFLSDIKSAERRVCPKCGNTKYEFENYCDNCQIIADEEFELEIMGNIKSSYHGSYGTAYVGGHSIMIIVKKYEAYYILGGSGDKMPEMGIADFDPSNPNYQNVIIRSLKEKEVIESHSMRILSIDQDLSDAEEKMKELRDANGEMREDY
jgi:hypothetical protein